MISPQINIFSGGPDFLDLPWDQPLEFWSGHCPRLEEVPLGVSRHPVVMVNYDGLLYALKELPAGQAQQEYGLLSRMETMRLPAVSPLGYVLTQVSGNQRSILITRYLDRSLPYRTLFLNDPSLVRNLSRYRQHLLDAVSSLLVQLHLADVYWGDCSLSNTLFRRDAGALQAYLVDAETAEIYPDEFTPMLRFHDLEIMEENINGELIDLYSRGIFQETGGELSLSNTGAYIRLRYQELWEEITREELIAPGEHFRITERIRALNAMGFSVGNVELTDTQVGDQLRLRVLVTDRNFHREQIFSLTGLEAEEMQARQMMNEIQELKATLSRAQNHSIPLSVAANYWLEHIYHPVTRQLAPMVDENTSLAELYCQLLEHKWFLSEKACLDVGYQVALDDYLHFFESN